MCSRKIIFSILIILFWKLRLSVTFALDMIIRDLLIVFCLYLPAVLFSTGNSGVVRDGLTNALIPNGWSWGGVVSDHCPVWVEVYTNKDLDTADLSIGPEAIKFTLGTEG